MQPSIYHRFSANTGGTNIDLHGHKHKRGKEPSKATQATSTGEEAKSTRASKEWKERVEAVSGPSRLIFHVRWLGELRFHRSLKYLGVLTKNHLSRSVVEDMHSYRYHYMSEWARRKNVYWMYRPLKNTKLQTISDVVSVSLYNTAPCRKPRIPDRSWQTPNIP